MSRTSLQTILITLATLLSASAQAQVCRVTTDGTDTGDGSDWDAQAMDPHTALADANCTEIWVAGGVYKPHVSDANVSFTIDRQVEVYGGFGGTETSLGERDPEANLTILSGDIDDNDAVNADGVTETADDIVGDNSYHVVFIDGATASGPITGTTVIDGFVITAGQADDTFANEGIRGGGLFCAGGGSGNECSPTLGNLVFSGNSASQDGGAMYNNGRDDGISNPALNQVIFSGNYAAQGGAMFNDGRTGGVSSPVLNYVRFSGNNAVSFGGAMYNDGGNGGISSPALNHVVFNGNGGSGLSGVSQGGAIYNRGESAGVSSPVLNKVTFSENKSLERGGAMYNNGVAGTSNPELNNVTFSGNSAPFSFGGAMFNDGNSGVSSPVLNNVTFSGNSASQGGAMANQSGSTSGTSSPVLNNVIVWGNSATAEPAIANLNATPVINDSIVQGSCPDGSICNNIIDTDPLLGPLADNGGFTQTLLPGADGSAIDAGNDATCTDEDQRGVSRPQGDSCDIGAVELRHLALEFDPADLDFGSIAAGATSEALITTLENSGDTDLTGLAFTVPAGFDADTGDCGAALPIGASCQVSVTFAPTAIGPVAQALVADSAEGADAELQLAGIGVEPGMLGTDPDHLHFEEVVITRTRVLSFNIVNTAAAGGTGVELSSVTVESGGPAFAIAGIGCAGGTVLDPGESCAVDISFTPQQVILHEGAVRVTDEDGQEHTMSLSGTVLPDEILADRFEQPPPAIR